MFSVCSMLSMISLSLVFGLSMSLSYTFTPLSMGLWVLLMSLFSSVYCGLGLYSWFGLMLFLIYVGGMLVMFAYFLAIEPNQHFDLMGGGIMLFMFTVLGVISSFGGLFSNSTSGYIWLTAMFSTYNLFIFVILGLVLFLALLSVVKISLFFMGPLRSFSYV